MEFRSGNVPIPKPTVVPPTNISPFRSDIVDTIPLDSSLKT
jgi:hypothetical protein